MTEQFTEDEIQSVPPHEKMCSRSSISHSYLENIWMKVTFLLNPKKQLLHLFPCNYRLVSLTYVVVKVFERLMNKQSVHLKQPTSIIVANMVSVKDDPVCQHS